MKSNIYNLGGPLFTPKEDAAIRKLRAIYGAQFIAHMGDYKVLSNRTPSSVRNRAQKIGAVPPRQTTARVAFEPAVPTNPVSTFVPGLWKGVKFEDDPRAVKEVSYGRLGLPEPPHSCSGSSLGLYGRRGNVGE